ncbi:MAG TPA: NAD(P)(+) transhydrogenase (Re/Si-specific) subunit alpha, partial [Rhizomicrobium sp.]|nr:NAD(P)(+) transhydrogenase (Re/Si-specific) subunit alpha [Rhizomicrobium sp.]
MKLAVPRETANGETRVAATPESVKKFKSLGLDVAVEAGAGAAAHIADADYAAMGASIAPDARGVLADADIVLKVRGPSATESGMIRQGAVVAALLAPHSEKAAIAALASQGAVAFAMEFLPRISRAQAMDVLSSQANLAGYRAVLDAASEFGRAF